MKKVSIIFAALFVFAASFAQIAKEVVVVEKFEYTTAFGTGDVEIIRNNVISSLQNTGRVIVIDVKNQEAQAKEAIRRASEGAANDSREVSEIGTLCANYILKGLLNTITVTKKQRQNYKTKQMEPYAEAVLDFSITLINPSNGATIGNWPYQVKKESTTNAQEARNAAVNESAVSMKSFIEECFPLRGKILQVADGTAAKVKSVYINLGSDNGVGSGQMFDVYEVVDIAGETSEKLIGAIKAKEVMSGTRTTCTVSSGADVIASKLAANKELTIKSRMKKSLFGL